MFGSNTILVFKYPLLKRKLQQAKMEIISRGIEVPPDQLDQEARVLLINRGLVILNHEESKHEEDEDKQKRLLRVEDYTEEEIE